MEHTVSYFFLLIPLPLKHRGLWDLVYRQNASPTSTKKKLFMILNSLENTIKAQNIIFIIPEPQNNSAFSFFIPEYELLWFTFLPKVSQWFHF